MNERTQEITELMASVEEVFEGVEDVAASPAQTHSLLEVWASILSNIDLAAQEKITPEEAGALISRYSFMRVQETPRYLELYYTFLREYHAALTAEIESDSECLKRTEPQVDAEENRHHYMNLLTQWMAIAMRLGLAWDATTEEAHLELAALNEARNFVIGSTGIVAHLESINFTLSPDERDEIDRAVLAAQES